MVETYGECRSPASQERRGPGGLSEIILLAEDIIKWLAVCAPVACYCGKEAPRDIWGGIAVDADVEGTQTVVTELENMGGIIYRRGEERIAHTHTPVLPARIEAMVIVIVYASI